MGIIILVLGIVILIKILFVIFTEDVTICRHPGCEEPVDDIPSDKCSIHQSKYTEL